VSDLESPLADALRSKLDATKEMLTTVVQRGSPTLLKEQFYMKAQAAQAEVCCLRNECGANGLSHMRSVRPYVPKWHFCVRDSSDSRKRKTDIVTTSLQRRREPIELVRVLLRK
jgi:hypothetical protein